MIRLLEIKLWIVILTVKYWLQGDSLKGAYMWSRSLVTGFVHPKGDE